jgi:hypothetical protein
MSQELYICTPEDESVYWYVDNYERRINLSEILIENSLDKIFIHTFSSESKLSSEAQKLLAQVKGKRQDRGSIGTI